VRPPAKLLAAKLGLKPSSSMTASTWAFLASLTCAVPFKILETVLGDTPALEATMLKVALTGLPADAEELTCVICGFITTKCSFLKSISILTNYEHQSNTLI
jgi:hypothetical protein